MVTARGGRGFSLVEMAVMLTVFSLMMGGMLVPLAKQYQFRREREARDQLGAIVESLYGYALIHGRLPAAVSGDRLPWSELGVPETDPWGRPWRYRAVDGEVCSPAADIHVRDLAGRKLADVAAVVISEGERQFGSDAERENRDADADFVKDVPSRDRFDDLVAWVHPTVLKNRAILAGLCGDGGEGDEDDDD